ncbi:MAG: S-layer homology domain-containing protein, partial [Oscillospiraceae bacterium]|nr:S-layer homology domain-containing protein [Oscillospiraceae bacterium]
TNNYSTVDAAHANSLHAVHRGKSPITNDDGSFTLPGGGIITLPGARSFTGFIDNVDIANYAKEAVERFFNANIIGGYPDGSFKPKGEATRAEVATMLMSL